jgi:hypothetical protein
MAHVCLTAIAANHAFFAVIDYEPICSTLFLCQTDTMLECPGQESVNRKQKGLN